MASIRQEKVARLLQREFGTYFQREAKRFGSTMVTPTVVRVSPDLGVAKVYLSIWGTQSKQEVLDKIQTSGNEIRRDIGNKVRHQLRSIPEFHFYIDDSLDYAENIENLLDQ
jgi:ribosome-binding factor A